MINILIHGLGQNNESWDNVKSYFNECNIKVEVPNLYKLNNKTFANLYNDFEKYCNSFNDSLNLCGLSLGGLLALEYTKKNPSKVNSLIIIGVPHKIPKFVLSIQNIIFSFFPNSIFEKIGITKKDFCLLASSMKSIDIIKNLENIKCKTVIMCGNKDKVNLKSTKILTDYIKNSFIEIIDNSSHEVNKDNPTELFKQIYKIWS